MSYLLSLFQWLWNAFKKAATFILSVPGMIASGVAGVCGVVASLFGNFTLWSDMSTWLDEASAYIDSLVGNSPTFQFLIGFLAVDRFVEVSTGVIAGTIGVTVAIFVTMFGAVIVLVPVIYGVKFAIRAISIFTGGFVKP